MILKRAENIEKVKFFLLDGISKKYSVQDAAEFFQCSKATILAAHKLDEEELTRTGGTVDYYTALMSEPEDKIYYMISILRLALVIKDNEMADLLKAKMAYDAAVYEEKHKQ